MNEEEKYVAARYESDSAIAALFKAAEQAGITDADVLDDIKDALYNATDGRIAGDDI